MSLEMRKVFHVNFLNAMRTVGDNYARIIEIGLGDNRNTSTTSGNYMAKVAKDAQYGIAIGHDAFVGKSYGIAHGNFQKVNELHGIAEGSYYNLVERYGEKRRTFVDMSNDFSRSWFEWQGDVTSLAEPPGPLPFELFLHNVLGKQVVLRDKSALTFNIKVVGTDKNATPNVNGYHLSGTIKRGTGVATTAIVGAVTKTAWEDWAAGDANVVADVVTGALKLQVLSHPTNTWYWAAAGWVVEMRWA